MNTPMQIFKKHGAHFYENDEQAIIDAMDEYAEQQTKNLPLFDVVTQLPLQKVARLEVIDEKGRSYINWKPTNKVTMEFQDDCRTLKLFVQCSSTKNI